MSDRRKNKSKESIPARDKASNRDHLPDATGVPRREPLALSEDEWQLLAQPEVPLEQWRDGEALLGSKLARLTTQEIGRVPKFTKQIETHKGELRKRIANDVQLAKDFEFFTKKMHCPPEAFLHDLYLDCNMMHAPPRTVIAGEKKRTWPVDRTNLDALCKDLLAMAGKLRALGESALSPARDTLLRDSEGRRFPIAREKYVLRAFRDLPEIIHLYAGELRGNVLKTADSWPRSKKRLESLVKHTRQHSLYERIRAELGQYHSVRLHRLVNAARQMQGLSPVEWHAFRKWLSELKQGLEKRQPALAPH